MGELERRELVFERRDQELNKREHECERKEQELGEKGAGRVGVERL